MPFPAGVPDRRRRPRRPIADGGGVIGAIIGGLLTRHPLGAIGGAILGSAEVPIPLDEALRAALTGHGFELVSLYRHGPFRVEALYGQADQYWSMVSEAPRVPGWTQPDLDDWLFGDLVGRLEGAV